VVLVELVVVLLTFLCFGAFFTFFVVVAVVLDDWLLVDAVDCPKTIGRLAAAQTIASKLFFIFVSPCGFILPSIPSSGSCPMNTIDSKG